MTDEKLCLAALKAMNKAYSPYSRCRVGAALLDSDGNLYTGSNIENAAFAPSVCAERVAFLKAVSSRESDKLPDFTAIAVAGGKDGIIKDSYPPCGVCRQVMNEFCARDFKILMVTSKDPLIYETYTLEDLLPHGFSLSSDNNGAD